jgi:hypothetical protein
MDFNFDANGIITDPGKFEGETAATVFYYEGMLNGWESDGLIELEDADKVRFDIAPEATHVRVDESNDGFVSLRYFTAEAAEAWKLGYNREDDWNDEDYDYE